MALTAYSAKLKSESKIFEQRIQGSRTLTPVGLRKETGEKQHQQQRPQLQWRTPLLLSSR